MIRLLLVDDFHTFRDSAADFLAELGYQVETAGSGAEALERFSLSHPHVVLLDLDMPGMDGLETLERLRLLDPDCRVIIVTGAGLDSLVIRALRLGACDYILKPFDREVLLRRIERAARARRPPRESSGQGLKLRDRLPIEKG